MNLVARLVNVGFVLNTLFIWCDAVNMVAGLVDVGLVRMLRARSRTSRTWPSCVAACVRVLDPFLVRIYAAWHPYSLMLGSYCPCFFLWYFLCFRVHQCFHGIANSFNAAIFISAVTT